MLRRISIVSALAAATVLAPVAAHADVVSAKAADPLGSLLGLLGGALLGGLLS